MATLRAWLQLDCGRPGAGVREAAQTWAHRSLSVRGLLAGPRVVHLSDLHFTDNAHTWDVGEAGIVRDSQDSVGKATALRSFLRARRQDLGTDHLVITGDLTDSGGPGDYALVRDFIAQLTRDGFKTSVVPGNHDCAWEGNLFFEDVFEAMVNFSEADIAIAVAAGFVLGVPPVATISVLKARTIQALVDKFLPDVPGADALVPALSALFAATSPIVAASGTDTAPNLTRRQRFEQYAAPGQTGYPVTVDIPGGTMVLLDSMQGQFDGSPRDAFAQGRLGEAQLAALERLLATLQSGRAKGAKVAVCLHHSPLHVAGTAQAPMQADPKGGLRDAPQFWAVVQGRVDAVLFGHTTLAGTHQQPRPAQGADPDFASVETLHGVTLLNCENLEHLDDGVVPACPVTVVDLAAGRRATYDAYAPMAAPVITWGTPPP